MGSKEIDELPKKAVGPDPVRTESGIAQDAEFWLRRFSENYPVEGTDFLGKSVSEEVIQLPQLLGTNYPKGVKSGRQRTSQSLKGIHRVKNDYDGQLNGGSPRNPLKVPPRS